ncbi:phospholipase A and acyltransferase 2 [Folsomia candida]|uniref:Retinoic acid receptor responder protein 3 n=1 Tax=Folsomia candida TaxID=158441 RepID=A0A226DYL4_FOLCA|nr:phospholipase A and acyltransferase 2 [Folsomia candida]OXA50383.1 Retinoic acid receptor responder protein 3 [Folsomia candida]
MSSSSDLSAWGTAESIAAIARPGDLIEFSRLGYAHWAVYIGNGSVIHVFLECKGLGNSAEIKEERLLKVCGGDKCRINNHANEAKKKGLQALPPEVVVANAKSYVGHETPYGLLSDNCEFFATSCRYGDAFCHQIDSKSSLMDTIAIICGVVGGVALGEKKFLEWKQGNAERAYESGNRTRAANQFN